MKIETKLREILRVNKYNLSTSKPNVTNKNSFLLTKEQNYTKSLKSSFLNKKTSIETTPNKSSENFYCNYYSRNNKIRKNNFIRQNDYSSIYSRNNRIRYNRIYSGTSLIKNNSSKKKIYLFDKPPLIKNIRNNRSASSNIKINNNKNKRLLSQCNKSNVVNILNGINDKNLEINFNKYEIKILPKNNKINSNNINKSRNCNIKAKRLLSSNKSKSRFIFKTINKIIKKKEDISTNNIDSKNFSNNNNDRKGKDSDTEIINLISSNSGSSNINSKKNNIFHPIIKINVKCNGDKKDNNLNICSDKLKKTIRINDSSFNDKKIDNEKKNSFSCNKEKSSDLFFEKVDKKNSTLISNNYSRNKDSESNSIKDKKNNENNLYYRDEENVNINNDNIYNGNIIKNSNINKTEPNNNFLLNSISHSPKLSLLTNKNLEKQGKNNEDKSKSFKLLLKKKEINNKKDECISYNQSNNDINNKGKNSGFESKNLMPCSQIAVCITSPINFIRGDSEHHQNIKKEMNQNQMILFSPRKIHNIATPSYKRSSTKLQTEKLSNYNFFNNLILRKTRTNNLNEMRENSKFSKKGETYSNYIQKIKDFLMSKRRKKSKTIKSFFNLNGIESIKNDDFRLNSCNDNNLSNLNNNNYDNKIDGSLNLSKFTNKDKNENSVEDKFSIKSNSISNEEIDNLKLNLSKNSNNFKVFLDLHSDSNNSFSSNIQSDVVSNRNSTVHRNKNGKSIFCVTPSNYRRYTNINSINGKSLFTSACKSNFFDKRSVSLFQDKPSGNTDPKMKGNKLFKRYKKQLSKIPEFALKMKKMKGKFKSINASKLSIPVENSFISCKNLYRNNSFVKTNNNILSSLEKSKSGEVLKGTKFFKKIFHSKTLKKSLIKKDSIFSSDKDYDEDFEEDSLPIIKKIGTFNGNEKNNFVNLNLISIPKNEIINNNNLSDKAKKFLSYLDNRLSDFKDVIDVELKEEKEGFSSKMLLSIDIKTEKYIESNQLRQNSLDKVNIKDYINNIYGDIKAKYINNIVKGKYIRYFCNLKTTKVYQKLIYPFKSMLLEKRFNSDLYDLIYKKFYLLRDLEHSKPSLLINFSVSKDVRKSIKDPVLRIFKKFTKTIAYNVKRPIILLEVNIKFYNKFMLIDYIFKEDNRSLVAKQIKNSKQGLACSSNKVIFKIPPRRSSKPSLKRMVSNKLVNSLSFYKEQVKSHITEISNFTRKKTKNSFLNSISGFGNAYSKKNTTVLKNKFFYRKRDTLGNMDCDRINNEMFNLKNLLVKQRQKLFLSPGNFSNQNIISLTKDSPNKKKNDKNISSIGTQMGKEKTMYRTNQIKLNLLKNCNSIIDYLYFYVKDGNLQNFIEIFKKFQVDSEIKDKDGNTFLNLATQSGDIRIATFLLESGADVNTQNKKLNSPLHYALGFKNYEISDLLIHYGANEQLKNKYGFTPWQCLDTSISIL